MSQKWKKELEWESSEDDEGKWAGSPLYIKPYGVALPYQAQTILRPVLRSSRHSQYHWIQIATSKNWSKVMKVLIWSCPELSLIGTPSPYTSKKLKAKTSLWKQLLLQWFQPVTSFHSNRNCTNPTQFGNWVIFVSSIQIQRSDKLMLTNLKHLWPLSMLMRYNMVSFPPNRFVLKTKQTFQTNKKHVLIRVHILCADLY